MKSDRIEDLWSQLRLHIEWAKGFSLILLFAQHPQPVKLLRERLADSLRLRTQRLRVWQPSSTDEVGTLAEQIFKASGNLAAGPLWVELWRHAAEGSWQQARTQLLLRLNERRFLLERDLRKPLLLLLPQEEHGTVYVYAPDLWAIRSFSADLPNPPNPPPRELRGHAAAGPARTELVSASRQANELEWERLWTGTADRARLDPRDGFAAFAAARERGDLDAAGVVAAQTLELARAQVVATSTMIRERNLVIAVSQLGDLAADLGDLEAARSAYGESLELRRRLRTSLGDTPQVLRDLSVSLDNVGGVAADLGDLEAARSAYGESLELRRRLRTSLGDTPQVLRDLSVSLERVGGVAADLGDLEAARGAYGESLALCRQLHAALPEHPRFAKELTDAETRWAALSER